MDEVLFSAVRKRGDDWYPFVDEELRTAMEEEALAGIMGSDNETSQMMLQRIFNGKLYVDFCEISTVLASPDFELWGDSSQLAYDALVLSVQAVLDEEDWARELPTIARAKKRARQLSVVEEEPNSPSS